MQFLFSLYFWYAIKDVLFIGIASNVEKAGPAGKAPCSPIYPRFTHVTTGGSCATDVACGHWPLSSAYQAHIVCALILAQGEGEGG